MVGWDDLDAESFAGKMSCVNVVKGGERCTNSLSQISLSVKVYHVLLSSNTEKGNLLELINKLVI